MYTVCCLAAMYVEALQQAGKRCVFVLMTSVGSWNMYSGTYPGSVGEGVACNMELPVTENNH